MGKRLLSEARKLEQEEEELDLSWVVDYSIKFQGCHHITQWNAEANGDEDVRIATKRLVRFRLCPTDSCDSSSSGGCSSGYGEYIIDMDTFLMAYLEDKRELEEWTCENYRENICGCDDDDKKDDAFEEEDCLNECYDKYGLDYCIEQEADDAGGEPFELDEYIECKEFNADRRRRHLEEEIDYFIGPYCSDQGGKIYLGMFTDDSCSVFADTYGGTTTYKDFTGESLPYSSSSIVGLECVSCKPLEDANQENNNNNNNNNGEVEVKEMCEQMWDTAGKCEKKLSAVQNPNKNACNFMDGIKVIRKDGVVEVKKGSSSAAAFIGIFAFSSASLGYYVYYLITKMNKGKIEIN